jgi:peptidoglycan/LPS O-acetylase OafA/YrhL
LAASFTLTIYLFHLPLLVLFHDALHARGLICLAVVIVSIVVLGYLTEHRRRELRALLMLIARKYRAGVSADDRAETLPIVLPTDATVGATGNSRQA